MAVLQPFGFMKDIITFWHKFTTGAATNKAVQPVILYNVGGDAYTAAGGGGSSNVVYGGDAPGTPPTHPPLLVGGIDQAGNVETLKTDTQGRLQTVDAVCAAGNNTSVAVNIAVVALQAANANRLGYSVYNDSLTSYLAVKTGAGATLTSFTVKLAPGGYWEMPKNYLGIITGIWDVADAAGAARNTEYV